MYVRMYTCMNVCIHTYVYTCTYIYVIRDICVYMCIDI